MGRRGFTLVELVMVILLLGVLATFSSQFIGLGTRIYSDASVREQLMSDIRFSLERLNREVRDAVPGSVRIEDVDGAAVERGACLRFWPIAAAGRYLSINQEIAGESALRLTMVAPGAEESMPVKGEWAIVYPVPEDGRSLWDGCASGRCVSAVTKLEESVSGALSLQVSDRFGSDSPARRVFFAGSQVRYCLQGGMLRREEIGDLTPTVLGTSVAGQPMAGSVAAGYFYRDPQAFGVDDEVGLRLELEQHDEQLSLDHKMAVWNVP